MARDRTFNISLVISSLFHLSMVTVFSIYIWIPVEEIDYYTFDIVDPVTHESVIRGPRDQLRVPSLEDTLRPLEPPVLPGPELGSLALSNPEPMGPERPQITLPTLEIAELERLHVREEGLRARSQFDMGGTPDAWSRFSAEVGRLQDALRRLTDFDDVDTEEEGENAPVSRPVDGLALYVEWMGEPENRELIFSPPIDALWKLDPQSLAEPIAIMFKVNAEGEVIEVMTPVEDEEGVIASAGKALIKYRFAPLESGSDSDQYGTLLIAPDEGPEL
ncbi:MAG: hypothetical protein IT364_15700 [Candidatus Hydrogenedentes bacterium]|nr:hypothetical protein [Candidatus Hydrogenedentota bacterium]